MTANPAAASAARAPMPLPYLPATSTRKRPGRVCLPDTPAMIDNRSNHSLTEAAPQLGRRSGSCVAAESRAALPQASAAAYGPDAPAAGAEALPPPAIPFGFTTFPGEIWRTPRSWVETCYPNVIYFNA